MCANIKVMWEWKSNMNISLATNKAADMYDNVSVIRKSMQSVIENATEIGSLIYNSPDDCNETSSNFTFEHKEYIFDRKEVRIIFITLYSLVFCCCFFGELTWAARGNPAGHQSRRAWRNLKQNQIRLRLRLRPYQTGMLIRLATLISLCRPPPVEFFRHKIRGKAGAASLIKRCSRWKSEKLSWNSKLDCNFCIRESNFSFLIVTLLLAFPMRTFSQDFWGRNLASWTSTLPTCHYRAQQRWLIQTDCSQSNTSDS